MTFHAAATRALAALALMTALAACGSDAVTRPDPITVPPPPPPPPPPAPVATVTLDATALVLDLGATRQLVATARDAHDTPLGLAVEWVAEGSDVARVSATGVVTAVQMGTTTVIARVGDKSARATVTVLGDARFDLLLERWAPDAGGVERPWLHRLDMRTPDAAPALVRGPMDASSRFAPSPDGTKVAFVCTNNGPAICIANADGSNGFLVPGLGGYRGLLGDQPAWSPDGGRIAFRGWAPGGPPGPFNPADIWVMDADGANKMRLTSAVRNEDSYGSPTWSPRQPDGSDRLAFSHVTRGADGYQRATIQSIRADGQNRLPVTAPGDHVDDEPTWSPDGRTIAFVRTGGTAAGDVWLVNAASGDERPLMSVAVEPAGAQRAPTWSPDGGLLAFASNHEIVANYYAYQIYTVRADGTALVRRTSDAADKGSPAWIRRR